jgi:short-subunit dehydrogenase
MSAAAVARQGHDATLAGRHLIVTGTPNRMVDLATRLLPRTLLLRLAGRAVDRG